MHGGFKQKSHLDYYSQLTYKMIESLADKLLHISKQHPEICLEYSGKERHAYKWI